MCDVVWLLIANTSMDPMLSMLMANMAQVRHGSLVCDPFVGSGQSLNCHSSCVLLSVAIITCGFLAKYHGSWQRNSVSGCFFLSF